MSLAHDSKMIEHLAVKKNSNMILAHFYRPNIRRDVAEHCRYCNICQVIRKQNQNIRVAPLRPVPVHIIVSKHRFPYLVLGRCPTQSALTLHKYSSETGTGRSGAVFQKQLSQIRDPMLCLIYFRKLCIN
jgi:hypothetical protein